jgi:heme oxygenase
VVLNTGNPETFLIPGSIEGTDKAAPPSGTRESTVLAALRAATRERHRVVDLSMPLSHDDATLADYVDHLQLMRAWLHPLERWLGSRAIRETALIDADLADAGVSPLRNEADTGRFAWPSNVNDAYRWGVRYVIEGSRLGAAVLYRRSKDRLAPNKLRYLQGGDEASTDHWPDFLRNLRAAVFSPADIADACQGARAGFDALLALSEARPQRSQRKNP